MKSLFSVAIDCRVFLVVARTHGGAARLAFAHAIGLGLIKRQPPSTDEGGWQGVSIECRGRA